MPSGTLTDNGPGTEIEPPSLPHRAVRGFRDRLAMKEVGILVPRRRRVGHHQLQRRQLERRLPPVLWRQSYAFAERARDDDRLGRHHRHLVSDAVLGHRRHVAVRERLQTSESGLRERHRYAIRCSGSSTVENADRVGAATGLSTISS
jgi:hypothetical protein